MMATTILDWRHLEWMPVNVDNEGEVFRRWFDRLATVLFQRRDVVLFGI